MHGCFILSCTCLFGTYPTIADIRMVMQAAINEPPASLYHSVDRHSHVLIY